MTTLIVGATGTIGGEVLRHLAASGKAVRAVSRGGAGAQRLRDAGHDVVEADLADAASLPAALAGIETVFVAQPASPDLPDREAALARAAAEAGVGLLVLLSVVGASADSPIGFGRMHAAAEKAVAAAGVPLAVLRPNGFMQNDEAWGTQVPSGTIAGPVADARWSAIDAADIGAVAVAALADPAGHTGKVHTLTGPVATSPRERVAILSELLGRPLEAQDVPIPAAVAQLGQYGVDAWTAERLGELFELYATGQAEGVAPDVEQLLGRPARDYETFAREHLDAFRGG